MLRKRTQFVILVLCWVPLLLSFFFIVLLVLLRLQEGCYHYFIVLFVVCFCDCRKGLSHVLEAGVSKPSPKPQGQMGSPRLVCQSHSHNQTVGVFQV